MLLGLVFEVLHLYFALFVEITFVAHKDFYGVGGADALHRLDVAINTLERVGGVDRVNNNDCVRSVKEVLIQLGLSRFTRSVPNI